MRRIITSIGCVVVVALSAIPVTSAAAYKLEFSKLGELSGKAVKTAEFGLGKMYVDCSESSASGALESGKIEVHELPPLSVSYNRCDMSFSPATVGQARYTYLLPELLSPAVQSEAVLTVSAKALGVTCEINIYTDQSLFGTAGEVEYSNDSGKILITTALTGVPYEVTSSNSPALCGTTGEHAATGTFKSKELLELEGGTIGVG